MVLAMVHEVLGAPSAIPMVVLVEDRGRTAVVIACRRYAGR